MKGSIPDALQELIKKNHGGPGVWKQILKDAGLSPDFKIYAHRDVDDETVKKLINSTATVLKIPYEAAADAFGDHWMTEYAPQKYFAFFNRVDSAKEFLLQMGRVHEKITANIENARPPKFTYEQLDEKNMTMQYHSDRHMDRVFVGLVKAVGHYYKEDIKVLRLSQDKVKITFP